MKLDKYLKQTNQSIWSFAKANKLSRVSVWRIANGKPARPQNAFLISDATNGAVTLEELLYPEKRQK